MDAAVVASKTGEREFASESDGAKKFFKVYEVLKSIGKSKAFWLTITGAGIGDLLDDTSILRPAMVEVTKEFSERFDLDSLFHHATDKTNLSSYMSESGEAVDAANSTMYMDNMYVDSLPDSFGTQIEIDNYLSKLGPENLHLSDIQAIRQGMIDRVQDPELKSYIVDRFHLFTKEGATGARHDPSTQTVGATN